MTEFEHEVIERLTRIETKVDPLVVRVGDLEESFGSRIGRLEKWRTKVDTIGLVGATLISVAGALIYPAMVLFGYSK